METRIDWCARAKELGETFAARAERHDAAGEFVGENYRELREAGMLSLAIPQELGGGGASYEETCEVLRLLGAHCGSTALALSMHQHLVAAGVWRYLHGQPAEALLRRVVNERLVLVSTGAGDWLESNGTARRVEGGYRVTAVKPFASGVPAGDLAVTSAVTVDGEGDESVIHFSVPLKSDGVKLRDDWNTLGMRGTGSQTVELNEVFVPDAAISAKRPRHGWPAVWSVVMTVAPPVYMAPYVGIAERAAQLALQACTHRSARDESISYLLGEMQNQLFNARIVLRRAVENVRSYDFQPDVNRADIGLQCKTLLTQAVTAAVDKAAEVAGGVGFKREFGLERLVRDVRAAGLHPLPAKRQQRFTGRLLLGLPPG